MTLARVAASLRIAPPSLYKHVGGLEDLTIRVATLAIRRLADRLITAAMGRSGSQALRAIAEAYRQFSMNHGELYLLTQNAPDPTSAEQRAEVARALEVFGAVVAGYGIPEELAVHAIRLIRAGLHGFTDIEARRGFQMTACVDESFRLLVGALDTSLHALRNRTEVSAALGHPKT